jgi:hypothetical protein
MLPPGPTQVHGFEGGLKGVQAETGYRVEVATVRKLEFENDAFVFGDKLIASWYPKEQRDNKGVLLVVTSAKDGALTGGNAFMKVRARTHAGRGEPILVLPLELVVVLLLMLGEVVVV